MAVLPFSYFSLVKGGDGKLGGEAISTMIMTELGSNPALQLVDRHEIDALLTRQQIMVSGRMPPEAALRAGQLLGAQYIVTGSVTVDPRTARLDIRIIDVETGAPARPPIKKSGNPDNLIALVEDLAHEFSRDLTLPDRAATQGEAEVPVEATLAYSRGLDYEKRGDREQAAKMYRKALDIHPAHARARAGLGRVRVGGSQP